MKFPSKVIMHAKLAGGGWMYLHELTQYPGVQILIQRADRNTKDPDRIIGYGDLKFDTIEAAVEAWKWDHPEAMK